MDGPDTAAAGNMETIDGADAGGQRDERLLRGDERVVQARRELAADGVSLRLSMKVVSRWVRPHLKRASRAVRVSGVRESVLCA